MTTAARQFTEGLAAGIDLAHDALDDRLDHQSRELLAELRRNIASLAERGKLTDEAIETRIAELQTIFPAPQPPPAPRPAAAAPPPPRPAAPPAPAPRRRTATSLFTNAPKRPLFPFPR